MRCGISERGACLRFPVPSVMASLQQVMRIWGLRAEDA